MVRRNLSLSSLYSARERACVIRPEERERYLVLQNDNSFIPEPLWPLKHDSRYLEGMMAERSKALESGRDIQSERAGVRISLMSDLFVQSFLETGIQSNLDIQYG